MSNTDFYRIRSNLRYGKARRTINGGLVNKEMVGYCHLEAHPGYLTTKILKEHRCIDKKCTLLEKNSEHYFWITKDFSKRKRALRKAYDRAFRENIISAETYSDMCEELKKARRDRELTHLENVSLSMSQLPLPTANALEVGACKSSN